MVCSTGLVACVQVKRSEVLHQSALACASPAWRYNGLYVRDLDLQATWWT